MSVWTDNAARFATRATDVDESITVVLRNVERDLAAAKPARHRRGDRTARIGQQRDALAAAAGPLDRLSRASGRVGRPLTFDLHLVRIGGGR